MGKVALITGGDSGIGKAAAIAFAKEGADIAIAYLWERSDSEETRRRIEQLRRRCLLIECDQGHKELIDYSSTKGAIVSFTRSLALSLVGKGIRVNSVAPGPVWTPLIPSSFSAEDVSVFGLESPMKRAAQPYELAGAYVYLACSDSSYVTGECIHVDGGEMVTT